MKQMTRRIMVALLIVNLVFPNGSLAVERLTVMNLNAKNRIDPEVATRVSAEIKNQIDRLEMFTTLGETDTDASPKVIALLQNQGCEDDNLCLINLGGKLDSRFMVAGSIAKIDDTHQVALKMIDTAVTDPGVKARASRACECDGDELTKVARVLAVQLIYNYYKGNDPDEEAGSELHGEHWTRTYRITEELAKVKEENAIADDENWFWRNKWWILAGVVVIGAGAALAAGGGGSSDANTSTPAGTGAGTPSGNLTVSW